MTERPILFSGPMVRAILAGTKTQTRRIVSPANSLIDGASWPRGMKVNTNDAWVDNGPSPAGNPGPYLHAPVIGEKDDGRQCRIYPLYQVGDPLWVRETWAPAIECHLVATLSNAAEYRADGRFNPPRWRPSIYMPRWASRLTLGITEVRIERVQDVSEADAIAEGCHRASGARPQTVGMEGPVSAREDFRDLWDSINGKRAPWDANPWVWALTFEVLR